MSFTNYRVPDTVNVGTGLAPSGTTNSFVESEKQEKKGESLLEITRQGECQSPFEGKTVFACFAEKREHLFLLVKRFHMRQLEAVHALLSSFALVTPCVQSSREEELYQSNSTNELVVPNGLALSELA